MLATISTSSPNYAFELLTNVVYQSNITQTFRDIIDFNRLLCCCPIRCLQFFLTAAKMPIKVVWDWKMLKVLLSLGLKASEIF